MARPTKNGSGGVRKQECGCGNRSYKTRAQLREHGTDACRPCSDKYGEPVYMTCPDPLDWAITPQGQAQEALAHAEREGERLAAEVRRAENVLVPQLQCKCCRHFQSKAHSAHLISTWERQSGAGYGGDELLLVNADYSSELSSGEYGCEKCGGDRMRAVVRGKRKAKEEEAWAF